MSEFFSYVASVLMLELRLGSVHLTLGAVALGAILLRVGVAFYHSLQESEAIGEELQTAEIDKFLDDAWYEKRYGVLPSDDGHD